MKDIDKDFYCPVMLNGGICLHKSIMDCKDCKIKVHKHPTPEEFKKEYGEDVPDDMPVWFAHFGDTTEDWNLSQYRHFEKEYHANYYLVCACTPFGKPDDNWRPQ